MGNLDNVGQSSSSDLHIDVLTEGVGIEAKVGNQISVRYVGMLEDGKIFDKNTEGAPFTFTLGRGDVISGWDLGLVGMRVGEKRKLTIPSELAYGELGFPNLIPPKSTLIFEVELLEIK